MRCKDLPTRGFTLIELLVVIALLGILIGLIMPSVKGAKDAAKRSTTSTLLYTINQGLEMFKSEELFGRTYPPSYWLAAINPGGSPYGRKSPGGPFPDGLPPTNQMRAVGAQTLVWAMVGADFLGTPGFQDKQHELYELDQSSNPVYPRRGPFVDPTDMNLKAVNATAIGIKSDLRFLDADIPVFVDPFDMPILYYKAYAGPDYYHASHNEPLTAHLTAKPPNEDPQSGQYQIESDGIYDAQVSNRQGLRGYLTDSRRTSLTGIPAPYKQNSFVLISAGKDMRYGTGDDILNFKKK